MYHYMQVRNLLHFFACLPTHDCMVDLNTIWRDYELRDQRSANETFVGDFPWYDYWQDGPEDLYHGSQDSLLQFNLTIEWWSCPWWRNKEKTFMEFMPIGNWRQRCIVQTNATLRWRLSNGLVQCSSYAHWLPTAAITGRVLLESWFDTVALWSEFCPQRTSMLLLGPIRCATKLLTRSD